jgi:hypothetical protein
MKQTAVEWLVKELGLEGRNHTFYNTIEQAKAMEKEQIINAIDSQYNYDKWPKELPTLGEQYYNETYKK